MVKSVLPRLRLGAKIRPPIVVVPDNEMRERERPSLNMLPNLSDWGAPDGPLSARMAEMREPVCIHRKSWEYALCVEGMHQLGAFRPDAVAIAVGAGYERPLFYFANCIKRMVATDIYDGSHPEGAPTMLDNPAAFAPFPYREDHLSVMQLAGDKLDFPDATFDFAFSLSSIEHFGSRAIQRCALDEMARVVKPGGFICIITELILTAHWHVEYFRWEEIEAMFLSHPQLQLVGGEPDLAISRSLIDYPCDLRNSKRLEASPHIVLQINGMLWTSLSLFFRKR